MGHLILFIAISIVSTPLVTLLFDKKVANLTDAAQLRQNDRWFKISSVSLFCWIVVWFLTLVTGIISSDPNSTIWGILLGIDGLLIGLFLGIGLGWRILRLVRYERKQRERRNNLP